MFKSSGWGLSSEWLGNTAQLVTLHLDFLGCAMRGLLQYGGRPIRQSMCPPYPQPYWSNFVQPTPRLKGPYLLKLDVSVKF